MAWIESHQELGHHPKLKKLCRVLGISQPQAVGHLQYLWWWSLDYCDDGDLSRFDVLDVAIGAMWERDAEDFVNALLICGWLDSDGETTRIHDWNEYLGRLLERRRRDAERKRMARGVHNPSAGHPEDGARTAHVTVPYPTVPNPTEQNSTEEDPPLVPPVGGVKPTPKRKVQIPDSWKPDEKGRAYAVARGMPEDRIDAEVQRWKNFHAGKGNVFANFAAAWRTWSDNYLSMNRSNITPMNRAGPGSGPFGRMTVDDHLAGVREAQERERRAALGGQT